MPPDATASEADNKPIPSPLPSTKEGEPVGRQIPPLVLERMKRVDPTLARRYEQRSGQ